MKNKKTKTVIITLVLIPCICIVSLIKLILGIVSLYGGIMAIGYGIEASWLAREYEYYSNEENFVEFTSEISEVRWRRSGKHLGIVLADVPEGFSENYFDLEGKAYTAVVNNGGRDYLQPGATVTIVSAPRYFGDGYIMPIVAMSVDGHELLSYEDGYKVLMDSYSKSK